MRTIPVLTVALALLGPAFAKVNGISKLPLSFEPNRGQAESKTLYLARGHGYLLSVESSGSRILVRHGSQSAEISSRLVGSNVSPRLEALDPLPGHSSYFRGQDSSKWLTGVPNFAKVRASGVYPGIDLVYYGNQSQLEYDFVLSPGADPGVIRMRFDGVKSLRADAEGNLVLSTAVGEITQRKPVIYQVVAGERKPILGRFVVHSRRTVSFEVASYNRSKSLVIDPVLVYSSYLGGSATDEGHAVAADSTGNLYLTGVTFSTPAGDSDVLVRKITPDGSGFVYNADIGGSGGDIGNGIAVDSNGSAYVGGRTDSTDFPVARAFQDRNFGKINAFVLRLDPSGSRLIFSTYFGGTADDRGFAIALDNQGSVYLTGAETSTDFPVSDGSFRRQNSGGMDCFVAKLDSQGTAIFSTLIGGGSDDQAYGIAVDGNGNSYITGQTNSDNYPQANVSFRNSRRGGLDAFVTEISADGSSLIYSTFAGGSSDDRGEAIAVDASGNAYIVGTTSSSDFPTTNGAYQTRYAGGDSDAFVLAFDVNAQLIFSTFLGSRGTDEGNGIALDSSNNVYITGDSDSDQYPTTRDAVQPSRRGGFDVVFSILTPFGDQVLYSTFLGGSGDDFGFAIALDPTGNAYLTGVTSSNNFPVTRGAAQPQAGGGDADAFFAQIGSTNFSIFSDAVKSNPASAFHRGMTPDPIPERFAPSEPASGRRPARVR